MPPTTAKISNYKAQIIRDFIHKDLDFHATYEQSLKELYFAYKNNCTHSFPLGKLLFKNYFLKLAEIEGYEVVAHSTKTGVIFEGITVRPKN